MGSLTEYGCHFSLSGTLLRSRHKPKGRDDGEQMPGRNLSGSADGRYKYISVEQGPETSLYATGPRLYDPWSGTFLGVDPMASDSTLAPWSPYQYSFDNTVRFKDPTGKWPGEFALEAYVWLTTQFSSTQNSIVNSMGYQNASQEQMQSQAESQSSAPMVPTAKQMSELKTHVVSDFAYAEGMGSIAGLTGTLAAVGVVAVPEASLFVTDASAGTELYTDYKSGSGTQNVYVTAVIGLTSYFPKVPVGAAITGAGFGAWSYQKLVPAPLGF